MPRKQSDAAPSCHSEFVASWKDWNGAVCVELADYERLERVIGRAQAAIDISLATLPDESLVHTSKVREVLNTVREILDAKKG